MKRLAPIKLRNGPYRPRVDRFDASRPALGRHPGRAPLMGPLKHRLLGYYKGVCERPVGCKGVRQENFDLVRLQQA